MTDAAEKGQRDPFRAHIVGVPDRTVRKYRARALAAYRKALAESEGAARTSFADPAPGAQWASYLLQAVAADRRQGQRRGAIRTSELDDAELRVHPVVGYVAISLWMSERLQYKLDLWSLVNDKGYSLAAAKKMVQRLHERGEHAKDAPAYRPRRP